MIILNRYHRSDDEAKGEGEEEEEAENGKEFDEFYERTFPGMGDITPSEYTLLRNTYSGDPFPMCSSFDVRLYIPILIPKDFLRIKALILCLCCILQS